MPENRCNQIALALVPARRVPYIGTMKFPFALFRKKNSVTVLRLEGVIGGGSRIGGPALNDAALAPLIEAAFSKGKPKAVALAINSPGGSPVQSSLIAARIRRLSEEKDIPVHAFVEDVAASGGYWLATAADTIHLDKSSIAGSIGVISASFGFHELIERHGIERRVITAGKDKSMLDPFRPERAEDVERVKKLQKIIHDNFIEQVTSRRGDRLNGEDLFTGEIWVGQEAIGTGLADNIGHLVPVMKDLFGEDVKFNVMRPRRSIFKRFGIQGVSEVMSGVEENALWSRFGLQKP